MRTHFLLFCEHSQSPLDVQSRNPRFGWQLRNGSQWGKQIGYRVRVSGSIALSRPLWDSGWVESANSVCVVYAGEPLRGKSTYFWQVSLRCEQGQLDSPVAQFETAIFEDEPWNGRFISHPAPREGYSVLLRKTVVLPEAPVKARAYVCGLGLYRLHINGVLASNRCLEPAWTNYNKTLLYSVLDITPLLQPGENVLLVELGKGTYGQRHTSFKVLAGIPGPYAELPRLLMDMDIFTASGLIPVCTQPDGWYAGFGDIVENDLYDGEVCDGRIQLSAFCDRSFSPVQAGWPPAAPAAAPGGLLRASRLPPIRVVKELEPASVKRLTKYKYLVDFGQNFAGWVRVTMRGQVHKRVTLKHGEVLDERGYVSTDNLRDARAIDNYVLRGGEETYEPRFTYHGFRYVEITMEEPLEEIKITGCAVNSDVSPTGTFSCGNEVLNGIQRAMLWTECSNLHGMPDACAQRDERMAWLNDMTVRLEESLYNFDMLLLYEKWMEDIRNEQRADLGSIPDTAPFIYGGNPAYHVSSVYVLLPWFLYVFYGDDTVLKKYYPSLRRYVDFLASQRGEDGLIGDPYYGDWVAPLGESILGVAYNGLPANIPNKLITTGYLYYDCLLMQKMASLAGFLEDIPAYEALAAQVQKALNTSLLDEKGWYRPNSQGANAFPLFLGLVPTEQRQAVASSLLQNIQAAGYHITTGNQTTKYLFETLDKLGENNTAFAIASSDTYPSLGYMIKEGATALWERWENEIGSSMNSHNQPMLGAYTSWFYKALGGLRLDSAPDGLQTVTLSPSFVRGLPHVQTSLQTTKGLLSCHWKRKGEGEGENTIILTATIPWNMTARLELPPLAAIVLNGKQTDCLALQPNLFLLQEGEHKAEFTLAG